MSGIAQNGVTPGSWPETGDTVAIGAGENSIGSVGGHSIVWKEADGTKTRPNNTTAYAANQAIGATADVIFKWTSFFRKNANTGTLTGLRVTVAGSGIAAANMGAIRAHLFTTSPTLTSNADQGTYNTLNSNKAIGLGYVDFSSWVIAGAGSDVIGSYGSPVIANLPLAAAAGARDLYAVLATQPGAAGFTPLAQAVIDMFASAFED